MTDTGPVRPKQSADTSSLHLSAPTPEQIGLLVQSVVNHHHRSFTQSGLKLHSRSIQIYGRSGCKFSSPKRIADEVSRTYSVDPLRETIAQALYHHDDDVFGYWAHLVPPCDGQPTFLFTCSSEGIDEPDRTAIWLETAEVSGAQMGAMGPQVNIPALSAPSRGGGVSSAFLCTLAAYNAVVRLEAQDMTSFEMETRLVGSDRVALFAEFSDDHRSHWPWAMFVHSIRMQMQVLGMDNPGVGSG